MTDTKKEAAEIMMQIMRALKEVMQTGESTVLVYADAEILIRKREVEQ
jgi:hypothetical protein